MGSPSIFYSKRKLFPNILQHFLSQEAVRIAAADDYLVIAWLSANGWQVRRYLPTSSRGTERVFQSGHVGACGPGFYKPTQDDISPCLPCPAGTFQPAFGEWTCLPCSDSQYCPPGASVFRNSSALFQLPETVIPFPLTESQLSLQQRVLGSLFSPSIAVPGAGQPFWTVLGTAIALFVVIIALFILKIRGKLVRYALEFVL